MSTTAPEAPPVTDPAPPSQPDAPSVPQQAPPPASQAQPAAPVPSPPPSAPQQGQQAAQASPEPAQQPQEPSADAAALKAERDALKAERDNLKAEAARWKQMSRQQEQRSKANHTEVRNYQDLTKRIAEHLGIAFDDKPDPAELEQRLGEAQSAARSRSVELAVYTTAATAGANAAALLDSREFMGRTAQLDPDAADFSSQVADLVREAAQQERYQVPKPPPVFAPDGLGAQPPVPQQAPAPQAPAQPPAPANGADFSGAPGGNRLWTLADYEYWTEPGRDRDGTVMAKAIEDGLLVNLGIGKPKARRYR